MIIKIEISEDTNIWSLIEWIEKAIDDWNKEKTFPDLEEMKLKKLEHGRYSVEVG